MATLSPDPPTTADQIEPGDGLRVLNLVTNGEARFYQQQLSFLESKGVECTTLEVPRDHGATQQEWADGGRSVGDYLRFYPTVLRHALGDYDVVHANYGLTAPLALAQPNLPVVLSLWGSDLFGSYGWLSKRCARHCDAVIVMSEEMATELGGDPLVLPHGIDTERFAPEPQAQAQAHVGWDPETKHVLFPYAPSRTVKNYPLAERVVERVADRFDGPVQLEAVHGVPHEEVVRYMNAADALLLTSRREGSPNSVKEALACGLPVVATDVGDVRERLRGVNPSTVAETETDLVDGLLDALRAGKPSNGREIVGELSMDRMADRLVEVYRRVSRGSDPLISVTVG